MSFLDDLTRAIESAVADVIRQREWAARDHEGDAHVMITHRGHVHIGPSHLPSVRCWCGPLREEAEASVVVHSERARA